MKYIDADKLIARLSQSIDDETSRYVMQGTAKNYDYTRGMIKGFKAVIVIVREMEQDGE